MQPRIFLTTILALSPVLFSASASGAVLKVEGQAVVPTLPAELQNSDLIAGETLSFFFEVDTEATDTTSNGSGFYIAGAVPSSGFSGTSFSVLNPATPANTNTALNVIDRDGTGVNPITGLPNPDSVIASFLQANETGVQFTGSPGDDFWSAGFNATFSDFNAFDTASLAGSFGIVEQAEEYRFYLQYRGDDNFDIELDVVESSIRVVPEPSSLALSAIGIMSLLHRRRRA